MPHQCVRCNKFYEDGAKEILEGCSCGGRLFFFIRKDRLKQDGVVVQKLSREDKDEIEKDVFDLVGAEIDKEQPVILDFESIRVLKPGKFEVDLVRVFKNDPLIYKLEEGKYMIDLVSSFRAGRKK